MLAEALRVVLRSSAAPTLVVAGRTDAGVHARAQVCHVDVDPDAWAALPGRSSRSPAAALLQRLAGALTPEVVVRGAREVPADFDARFSALGREYRYLLADTAYRPDPLLRRQVAWMRGPLDAAAMQRATPPLLGEHDFVAFCRPRARASTIRTLRLLDVRRRDELVGVQVEADAFCHHQVRALVGALVAVGAGRRPEGWPADVLASKRRDGAVAVAPARGLTLMSVTYPPDEELRARAEQARRRRDAPAGDRS